MGECVSARWPKDTFDWSTQSKSSCKVDSNEGRVGGRIEGRTGVHVESEVVLKCEGNRKHRERVRHAVQDVRTTVLWDTTIPVDSMTQVLSHATKNHVCGSATYAWVWFSVLHVTMGLKRKKKSLFIPTWCLPPFFRWFPPRRRWAWWEAAERYHLHPVLGSTLSVPSLSQTNGWPRRCRSCSFGWSLLLLLPDSSKNRFVFDSFVVVFTLVHRAVRTWAVEDNHPSIFTSAALWCCGDIRVIFGIAS